MHRRSLLRVFLPGCGALLLAFLSRADAQGTRPTPWDLAWAPDGSRIAVSDRAGACLWFVAPQAAAPEAKIPLLGSPRGVAWKGKTIWVAEYDNGTVAELDAATRTVRRRLATGPKPAGLAVAGETLLVAEYGRQQLLGIDLKSGATRFHVPVERYPVAVASTPDGRWAVTAGLLPPGAATPEMAAEAVLVDVQSGKVQKKFPLPDGSSNVRGIAISPDGKTAALVHTRGRTALPTTQIDRGWISTNVITLLDLTQQTHIATCVLDAPYKGAADPWGVGFLPDGSIWITLAGTAELMHFDFPRFMRLLTGAEKLPPEKQWRPTYWDKGTMPYSRTAPQRWEAIAKDPALRSEFPNNMSLLSGIDLTRRVKPGLEGLRAIAPSPDGSRLAMLAAFDGLVAVANAKDGQVQSRTSFVQGQPAQLTEAEKGERLFFDGRLCFQGWFSCATCHHEARTDGLNWDLLNDGMGSPKNTKSMLYAHKTPPMTWTAVREGYHESITKGFYFLMYQPEGKEVEQVAAYFESLKPEPSPYLDRQADGKLALSAAAMRGKEVYEKANCSQCHSGETLTNLTRYDVGTGGNIDTPSLVELWRTAPYLHDGSAATLLEVLELAAKSNNHGVVSGLSANERQDLLVYLLSL